MDTLIEAARQALEALENAQANFGAYWTEDIIALRAAIASHSTAIHATELREQAAVAEPHKKQKPYRVEQDLYGEEIKLYTTPPYVATPLAAPNVASPRVQDECVVCGDKVRVIPRPWVGLTDEETADIAEGWAVDVLPDIFHVVRAIEAKLRAVNGFSCSATEKNGGEAI